MTTTTSTATPMSRARSPVPRSKAASCHGQRRFGLPAQPFAVPGATPPPDGGVTPQAMQPGPAGEQVTDSPMTRIAVCWEWDRSQRQLISLASVPGADGSQSDDHYGHDEGFRSRTTPPNTTWRMYFTANAPEPAWSTLAEVLTPKACLMTAISFLSRRARMATAFRLIVYGTTVATSTVARQIP